MSKWSEGLQQGDKVIFTDSYIGALPIVTKVERLTKKYIIVKGSQRKFRKRDGWQAGTEGLCRVCIIEPYTPEAASNVLKRAERNKMLKRCGSIRFNNLSDEQLETILTTITFEVCEKVGE